MRWAPPKHVCITGGGGLTGVLDKACRIKEFGTKPNRVYNVPTLKERKSCTCVHEIHQIHNPYTEVCIRVDDSSSIFGGAEVSKNISGIGIERDLPPETASR